MIHLKACCRIISLTSRSGHLINLPSNINGDTFLLYNLAKSYLYGCDIHIHIFIFKYIQEKIEHKNIRKSEWSFVKKCFVYYPVFVYRGQQNKYNLKLIRLPAFKQEEMMIQPLAGIFPNTGTKYVAPELAPGNLIVDNIIKSPQNGGRKSANISYKRNDGLMQYMRGIRS